MFLEMLNYKIPCMKLYCKGCLNSNENKVEFMTVKYCYKWKQNVWRAEEIQKGKTTGFQREIEEEYYFYQRVQCVLRSGLLSSLGIKTPLIKLHYLKYPILKMKTFCVSDKKDNINTRHMYKKLKNVQFIIFQIVQFVAKEGLDLRKLIIQSQVNV